MTTAEIGKETSYDVIYERDPWEGKKMEPSSQTSAFSVIDYWSKSIPPVPPLREKFCDALEISDRASGVFLIIESTN